MLGLLSKPRTIIVHGPQGSGKGIHAERMRKFFGCVGVVEANDLIGTDLLQGHLHLTCHPFSPATINGERWRRAGGRYAAEVFSFDFVMKMLPAEQTPVVHNNSKPTNPKDAVGIRKWRQYATVPLTVMTEVGVAMMEGALKYGRHNYRVAGVRASVYVDAAIGHIGQWWEGEDLDPDTKLSHITKAIASLVVVRDAMIQNMLNDDRPPKGQLDQVRANLQAVVDAMFEKYPESVEAFTELGERMKATHSVTIDVTKVSASDAAIKALIENHRGELRSGAFPLDIEAAGSGVV